MKRPNPWQSCRGSAYNRAAVTGIRSTALIFFDRPAKNTDTGAQAPGRIMRRLGASRNGVFEH